MKIDIHCSHPALGPRAEQALQHHALALFSPFADRLSEVCLRLTDQNGPRKGADLLCVATARFWRRGAIVAVTAHAEPRLAEITAVLRRLRRWVRKDLERRRADRRRSA